MKQLLHSALFVALASPALATEYRASNHMSVNAAGDGRFVVSGVPNSVPQSYWCAAGEYAQRVVGAGPEALIYVVGDYQRGQRSYTFSTSPAGTAAEQGRVPGFSVRIDGVSRKVNTARADCRDRVLRGNR